MIAKTLMIGDWVAFRGHPYRYTADDIATMADCEKKGIPTDSTEIPLTPEILEKNGFKRLVTYGTEKWICGDIRMNIYSSDGCWRFCADTKRNENSVIYIHFIHELQHAIRLCGIEKEIEL